MGRILRIARMELNILFYSPIAWLLLIIFSTLAGLSMLNDFERLLKYEQSAGLQILHNHLLTKYFFGVFTYSLQNNIYLFAPLITMGLISKEISSGSIKLLYSSPIKISDIVFGKYLSMMVFNLFMLLATSIYFIFGMVFIESADISLMLTEFFAVYLLLCVCTSIGLFMSSLTTYQIIAAIGTGCIFAFLKYVGSVWQENDWLRDLTHYLSIVERTQNLFTGLILSSDIIYFFLMIGVFLFLTYYRLASTRNPPAAKKVITSTLSMLIVFISIAYISSRPTLIGYFDTNATQTETLTPATQKILKDIGDEPFEVHAFINVLDNSYQYCEPGGRYGYMQRWAPYIRFKPNMKFKFTYYYDSVFTDQKIYKDYKGKTLKEIAQQFTKARKLSFEKILSPQQIRKIVNLKPEFNKLCMRVTIGRKSSFLRIFNDNEDIFPSEYQIAAALKSLTLGLRPKFLFLTGHYERHLFKKDEREFGYLSSVQNRYSLTNQGFQVDTINLLSDNLPNDILGLIIADPRTSLEKPVLEKIQRYIDKGGNLLIAGEMKKQEVINPLIHQFGVTLQPGMILQEFQNYPLEYVASTITSQGGILSGIFKELSEGQSIMFLGETTGLTIAKSDKYLVNPLLKTDKRLTWHTNAVPALDEGKIILSPQNGFTSGSFVTGASVKRKVYNKEQRIIITSDADWLSNNNYGGYNWSQNSRLAMAAFGWLNYGILPPDVSRTVSKDSNIAHLNVRQFIWVRVLCQGLSPALLLIVGSVILIRRKRH